MRVMAFDAALRLRDDAPVVHRHRPHGARDYGKEAIEILLQVMENRCDDSVVILAGY